jgi:hypothetical protein
MQRTVFSGLATTVLLAVATVLPASADNGKALSVPVAGSINGQAATGTLNISRFEKTDQQVFAVGTLALTYATATTPAVSQSVVRPVRVPVLLPTAKSGAASTLAPTAAAGPTCQVLSLTLGPLHLELLGLVIDLNQVVLNITAEQGGGILGDLLCAVANLLNGLNLNSLLQQLVTALNGILNAL